MTLFLYSGGIPKNGISRFRLQGRFRVQVGLEETVQSSVPEQDLNPESLRVKAEGSLITLD